jgi:hypothetical protein
VTRARKWPKECPVFEVIGSEWDLYGRYVVGTGPTERILCCGKRGKQSIGAVSPVWPDYGEIWGFNSFNLRPLTRAAREMLELVK